MALGDGQDLLQTTRNDLSYNDLGVSLKGNEEWRHFR